MNESTSFFTRFVLKALGAGHPIRLSIGIAIAVVLKIVADALALSSPGNAFLKGVSAYQMYWFVIACCPLAFIPVVLGKRNAPEAVVHTINTIQAILDRAKLSKTNEQMFWRALLDKYIAAAKPDLSGAPDMGKVFEEAKNEIPITSDQAPS
jgi:H+/Cl- antiporter ClcA